LGHKERKTRAMEVSENIREYIVRTGLKPQDMLPSIEKLAQIFNTSRGTVREALMHLSSSGIVRMEQGKGTWVAEPQIHSLLSSVVWKPLLNTVSSDELAMARCAIESAAVGFAAQNATDDELANLNHLCLEMDSARMRADVDNYLDLDRQWHHALAKMSHNSILAELTALLHNLALRALDRNRTIKCAAAEIRYHLDIANALAARRAETAKSLLERHIMEWDTNYRQGKSLTVYCDVLGTGSFGGSFYTLGQVITCLLGQYSWIKPVVHATGGGIENINLTRDRHIGLSIVQADIAEDAYFGRGRYQTPYKDLRYLCRLPGLQYQVVCLASSSIKSLSDLRGKRVSIGARGGTSAEISREILSRCGLMENKDYTSQLNPISLAVHMVLSGAIDAVCFLSMGQSSALLELACQAPVRLLSLEKELINAMLEEHPSWYECTVDADTYPGQTSPAQTIGVPTILVSHRDVPEADAYAVTAAVLRNIDKISALVRPSSGYSLSEAVAEVQIPRHIGAEKYLVESGLITMPQAMGQD